MCSPQSQAMLCPRSFILAPCALPLLPSLNLEVSLFERLENAGYPVHMLTVQYRMHPEIRAFPSGESRDASCIAARGEYAHGCGGSCALSFTVSLSVCLSGCLPACNPFWPFLLRRLMNSLCHPFDFRVAFASSVAHPFSVHASPLLRGSSHRRPLRAVSEHLDILHVNYKI